MRSASSALPSQSLGGLQTSGRFLGTWNVRSLSGSPLCRWVRKLKPASSAWMMPMKYQGIWSGWPTFS